MFQNTQHPKSEMSGTPYARRTRGGDVRNMKVVVALVISLTLGAAVLRWLETPTPGWAASGGDPTLTAQNGRQIESVLVEYLPPGAAADTSAYDCIILPDGQTVWRPQSSRVRLLVEGTATAQLDEAQLRAVMSALGSMNQLYGLDLRHVELAAASDERSHKDLPSQAGDLWKLLVLKGIVE